MGLAGLTAPATRKLLTIAFYPLDPNKRSADYCFPLEQATAAASAPAEGSHNTPAFIRLANPISQELSDFHTNGEVPLRLKVHFAGLPSA